MKTFFRNVLPNNQKQDKMHKTEIANQLCISILSKQYNYYYNCMTIKLFSVCRDKTD